MTWEFAEVEAIVGIDVLINRSTETMSLPENWTPLDYVPQEALFDDPLRCPQDTRNWLVGLTEGDERHRIYEIPSRTSFGEIARAFRVGSHGATNHGYDEHQTVELVAQKLDVIQGIAPGRAIFADTAGFKIRFERPISAEDYPLIEALFPEDEMIQAGLDYYLSEWSGEGRHPLESRRGSDLLHLWWD